jgi:hypothetical protein
MSGPVSIIVKGDARFFVSVARVVVVVKLFAVMVVNAV